jgi:hypothetical protein
MSTRLSLVAALLLAACAVSDGGATIEPTPTDVATRSPSPTESPTRSPTPSAEATPPTEADLVGVLNGDAQLEGGCAWLTEANGRQWEVMWPEGYHVDMATGSPQLIGPDGQVVARAGDTVAVAGAPVSGAGSICQVGDIFEATAVVEVTPG